MPTRRAGLAALIVALIIACAGLATALPALVDSVGCRPAATQRG